MAKYTLGLIPSPEDNRDYILTAMVPPLTAAPSKYELWLDYQTPVKNQGKLGSCGAFASAAILETLITKVEGLTDLSEQFIYDLAKQIDEMPQEEGTTLRAVLSVLKNVGVCHEEYKPYEEKFPPQEPESQEAIANAQDHKIISYARIGMTKDEIKKAIYQTGPIITGIAVYESFEDTGKDGIVPPKKGKLLGYHALPIMGYNEIGLIVKNSWSEEFGCSGYAVIPWKVWDAIKIDEAWSILGMAPIEKKSVWEQILSFFASLFS